MTHPTHTQQRLLASMKKQALFAIFLHEMDDGTVFVTSDIVGEGDNVFDIGSDILQSLKLMSQLDDNVNMVKPQISKYFQ
jgi:Tfp pilus assembly protein PilZ